MKLSKLLEIKCVSTRIIDGKIKEIWGDDFLKEPKNINELDTYKEIERCKPILKNRLNNKINMNKYVSLLESSKLGLSNLKFTYCDDQTITSNIDIIIDKIDIFRINTHCV